MKYPKFGFQRTFDIASRRIREGNLTEEEVRKLIRQYDPKLDQRALHDFLDLTEYTSREFWDIVERFWNRDIFEKTDGAWKLKRLV